MTIAYDGAPFSGWQSQTHGNTIQDHFEKAFRRVAGKKIQVHGAGRTDAGVHALGQCAHANLPDKAVSATRWQSALNGLLPPTIRVLRCRYVSQTFHSRFSAKGKMYRYRIWAAPVLPPFEVGRTWHVTVPLDFPTIVQSAASFVGQHDFARFAANRGRPEMTSIRTIHSARVKRNGPLITLEFKGDGFLYKMVRLMVGSIIHCGLEKMAVSDIRARLQSPDAPALGLRFVAPAQGLILVRVSY